MVLSIERQAHDEIPQSHYVVATHVEIVVRAFVLGKCLAARYLNCVGTRCLIAALDPQPAELKVGGEILYKPIVAMEIESWLIIAW